MKRYFSATILSLLLLSSLSYAIQCSVCGGSTFPTGKFQGATPIRKCSQGHINYLTNNYSLPSQTNNNIPINPDPFAPLTKLLKDKQEEAEKERALVNDLLRKRQENNRIKEDRAYQEQRELTNLLNSATTSSDDSGERGQITERWPNGLKKTVFVMKGFGLDETITKYGFTKDGKPDYITEPASGWTYKYYYDENGNIIYEGNFKDGKEDGLWTEWYENGQKSREMNFKDGRTNGFNTGWHESGQKRDEGTYKDGKEDGLWTEWYENGQKKIERTYKDGKPDGLVTVWYENGQKSREMNFKDGKDDGLWTSWYENGQKNGKSEFRNGQRDGLSISWYENGQKKIEGNFKDGKIDGKYTEWYENGQKSREMHYKNGERDGVDTMWNKNGQKMTEVTFKDGNQIEARIDFDEQGNKRNGGWTRISGLDKTKIAGFSRKGLRHGVFKFYDSYDTLKVIAHYKKGFLHGEEKILSTDDGKTTYMLIKWKKGKKLKTTGPFPFP